MGTNDLRECEKSQSETDLAIPLPSHEEGQALCFQNAADPTYAYTSLQQTSFLGYKLVQSSGQTLGMLRLSFLPRINTRQA